MKQDGLYAIFKIKNTGKEVGQAVPMMFLTFPDSIGEYPKYILKGLEKVEINPNEEKEVIIKADEHALSYFNVIEDNYIRIVDGEIIVNISDNASPSKSKLSGKVNAKY